MVWLTSVQSATKSAVMTPPVEAAPPVAVPAEVGTPVEPEAPPEVECPVEVPVEPRVPPELEVPAEVDFPPEVPVDVAFPPELPGPPRPEDELPAEVVDEDEPNVLPAEPPRETTPETLQPTRGKMTKVKSQLRRSSSSAALQKP